MRRGEELNLVITKYKTTIIILCKKKHSTFVWVVGALWWILGLFRCPSGRKRVKCSKTEQAEHFDSGLHFLAMWWLVWWEGGLGHYCISSWMDVRSCTPYIAQCNAERWEKEGGTLLQCLVWVGSEGGGSVGEWLAQQGQAGHCYQPLSPLFHQIQIQTQTQIQISQLEKKKV